MSRRILQPGEIEALDNTTFPRVLPPQIGSLFIERAARLRQLAAGNPIADYLEFAAHIVSAQHQAAKALPAPEADRSAMQRAQAHGMPLFPAAEQLDAGLQDWQPVLEHILDTLASQATGLPAALQPLLAELRQLPGDERDSIARQLLNKDLAARYIGMAPFVMAALQVRLTQRAASLREADMPQMQPATVCPVCASEPVASVIRIGGQASGHRYLHCGGCGTDWHMVRVKCSHCESTKGVHYQIIEGIKDIVTAETCDECGTYRKLVNQEKDPLAEPLADDLASLMLDLLMSETPFRRASANPLLYVAVAEEQADTGATDTLIDPFPSNTSH